MTELDFLCCACLNRLGIENAVFFEGSLFCEDCYIKFKMPIQYKDFVKELVKERGEVRA